MNCSIANRRSLNSGSKCVVSSQAAIEKKKKPTNQPLQPCIFFFHNRTVTFIVGKHSQVVSQYQPVGFKGSEDRQPVKWKLTYVSIIADSCDLTLYIVSVLGCVLVSVVRRPACDWLSVFKQNVDAAVYPSVLWSESSWTVSYFFRPLMIPVAQ